MLIKLNGSYFDATATFLDPKKNKHLLNPDLKRISIWTILKMKVSEKKIIPLYSEFKVVSTYCGVEQNKPKI